MFFDQNGINLEINNKDILYVTPPNFWKLNNTLLKGLWVKEEIKMKIKNRILN